jgi:hypothetical protein
MPKKKSETSKKTAKKTVKKTAAKKPAKKATKKTVKASAAPVTVEQVAVVAPPTSESPPPAPLAPPLTEAQKIWEEIRQVQLNMFALPDQTVEMYCKVYPIEPSRVYMTVKVSAVLAALEDTLGKWYNFDTAGKFVLVTRK